MQPSRTRIRDLTIVLFIAAFATVAHAQTTQPAQNWQETVDRLAGALCGKDLKTLTTVLDRGPAIRTFTSEMLQPPERLLGMTTAAKVLGLHAYPKLPSTLASDLAEDFKAADVPEGLRSDFVIADSEGERNANEVAARWLTQTLRPPVDAPVAVIVLWRLERADSFQNAAAKRPVFLLVRGELVDGQYIIRQIIYGDPLERPR